MAKTKRSVIVNYRDSKTGRFVSKGTVKRRKATTTTERNRRKKSG